MNLLHAAMERFICRGIGRDIREALFLLLLLLLLLLFFIVIYYYCCCYYSYCKYILVYLSSPIHILITD